MGIRIIIQGYEGEERERAAEIIAQALVKTGIPCVRHEEQMDAETAFAVFHQPKFATIEEVGVKAVNYHDELVKSLDWALARIIAGFDAKSNEEACIKKCREALAKAKGAA